MARLALAVTLMLTMAIAGPSEARTAALGWCEGLSTGAPVIDALGDSETAGTSLSDESQRWYSQLLASFRTDSAPGTQIWTGGAINGSATADYLPGAKYEGHIQFTVNQPNLIMLGWGTNDWAGGVTPPALFKSQYQQIISRIKTLAPNATLLIVHMPWVYNQSITNTRPSQVPYLDAEKELAQENGAKFLDLAWYFPGPPDPRGQYAPDQVHYSAVGQGFQYTAIRAFLLGLCS